MDGTPLCEKCGQPLTHGLTTGNLVHENGIAECSEAILFLRDPQMFDKITVNELDKKIVGEIDARKTIFLCACGRYVSNGNIASFNCILNSEASSGKDYILSKTLEIFPEQDYVKRTRITENVFTYWHNSESEPEWTWDGKIFYCEDISQKVLDSDVFKVMCSSGSHTTVLIKQKSVDIEIKGKPVIFVSTATANLSKEISRRFCLINCDETANQTREIMRRQAQAAELGEMIDYDPSITNALFVLKRVKVKIPFAQKICKHINADSIILRTVFHRFLDYIRASAALHQYQRKRDETGSVIAEGRDYEIAAIAIKKTISNTHFAPLTHHQKKLIAILKEMPPKENTLDPMSFTVDDIAAKVNFLEDRWLRENLNILAEIGIFRTGTIRTEGAKRDSKTYALLEIENFTLPSWEEVCN